MAMHFCRASGAVCLALVAACSNDGNPVDDWAVRAFADQHWHAQAYWDSLQSIYAVEKWHDADVFAHRLPMQVTGTDTTVLKNDEYYYYIGYFDQFIWGWDDLQKIADTASSPESNYRSNHRETYNGM